MPGGRRGVPARGITAGSEGSHSYEFPTTYEWVDVERERRMGGCLSPPWSLLGLIPLPSMRFSGCRKKICCYGSS